LAVENQFLDQVEAVDLMDDARGESSQRCEGAYRVFVGGVA